MLRKNAKSVISHSMHENKCAYFFLTLAVSNRNTCITNTPSKTQKEP